MGASCCKDDVSSSPKGDIDNVEAVVQEDPPLVAVEKLPEAERAAEEPEPMEETLSKQQELLSKLMIVEGRSDDQTKLFEELKSHGCIMIATLHLQLPEEVAAASAKPEKKEKQPGCCGAQKKAPAQTAAAPVEEKAPDPEQLKHNMAAISFVRGLLASCVWSEKVRLIKADEEKFFVFSESVPDMLQAACKIAKLSAQFPTWLKEMAPNRANYPQIGLKIGLEVGDVLLLPSDCYGDPVNVASKLGEDVAKTGEIFMGPECYKIASQDSGCADVLKYLTLKSGTVEISKAELEYQNGDTAGLMKACAVAPTLPKDLESMSGVVRAADIQLEELTIFVSDMSGFTKLTKKYGILHYMRLVLNVREIMVPLIKRCNGRVCKYDGDNVIAVFQDTTTALAAVDEGWRQIAIYNKSREEDFKIRMGCALDRGEVFISGKDMEGLAFDRSFHLAEEVAEKGQVLITDECSKLVSWDKLPQKVKVRQEKLTAEGGCGKIIHTEVDGVGQVIEHLDQPLVS